MTSYLQEDKRTSMTIRSLLDQAALKLKTLPVERPYHEARLLLEIASGWPIEKIIAYPEEKLTPDIEKIFEELLARRLTHEPISKIRGYRDFWKDRFFVTKDTLDPRADSEILIEVALNKFKNSTPPTVIVDVGVGTGCLLLSLLKEFPTAVGFGVDINPNSLPVFRKNIHALRLEDRCFAIQGSWVESIKPGFVDLIISNPPYIPSAEIETLDKDVRDFDPLIALDGGEDGLAAYQKLIPQASQILKPSGKIILEIGIDESKDVSKILKNSGYLDIEIYKDLNEIDRCIFAIFR